MESALLTELSKAWLSLYNKIPCRHQVSQTVGSTEEKTLGLGNPVSQAIQFVQCKKDEEAGACTNSPATNLSTCDPFLPFG